MIVCPHGVVPGTCQRCQKMTCCHGKPLAQCKPCLQGEGTCHHSQKIKQTIEPSNRRATILPLRGL